MSDQKFPDAVPKPCVECPWRRDSTPGFIGPHTAEEWVRMAHSEIAIACHMTIQEESWDAPGIRQCAGAGIFRANICKSPRNPEVVVLEADRETVFGWNDEFVAHHTQEDDDA